MTRYALKLNLLGCGDGGAVTSATSVAGRDSMMVMQSALLTGVEDRSAAAGTADSQHRACCCVRWCKSVHFTGW